MTYETVVISKDFRFYSANKQTNKYNISVVAVVLGESYLIFKFVYLWDDDVNDAT